MGRGTPVPSVEAELQELGAMLSSPRAPVQRMGKKTIQKDPLSRCSEARAAMGAPRESSPLFANRGVAERVGSQRGDKDHPWSPPGSPSSTQEHQGHYGVVAGMVGSIPAVPVQWGVLAAWLTLRAGRRAWLAALVTSFLQLLRLLQNSLSRTCLIPGRNAGVSAAEDLRAESGTRGHGCGDPGLSPC